LALLFYIPEVAMKRHFFALVVAVLFVVLPAKDSIRASTSSRSYTMEDLGTTSDGLVPVVTGMNASGQVSGYVNGGSARAVRFTNGVGWEYLPVPGTESYAMAINASGDVAGYHVVGGIPRAFRYTNGATVADTIALVTGGSMAWGFAINADGHVTGYGDAAGAIRGWLSKPAYPTVVLDALGDAVACGINDAGQIVGFYMTAAGNQHAYRLEVDGTVTDIVPFDGVTGTGTACAIDAAGHVGGSATSGATHADRAFRFLRDAPVNLDTFVGSKSSTVAAIAGGVSVGSFTTTDNVQHAFVHSDASGGSANLNALVPAGSGWYLHEAVAVNTEGQIVVHAKRNDLNRVFRLTPAKDTTAPVISAVSATPSTVGPPKGQLVDVAVAVTATDDVDDAPVCAVSSISATGSTADDYSFTGLAARVRAVGGRTYTLNVTCADVAGNVSPASSTNVVVPPDTTAPVISAVSATPSTVGPPKGQLVDVAVAATATDDVDDAPVCAVSSISATGSTADDYSFAGLAARVRAVGGRTYTLNVTCADAAGNVSPASSTTVVVPPDTTAPVISALAATPSTVSPTNGQLVDVAVLVIATDDVDAAPVCTLSSITASGTTTDDFTFTGLSARVRAVAGRTYTLNVTCADAAGNVSPSSSTNVVVLPDTTAPVIGSLHATPDAVWPPNGKMVAVSVAVSATDNVDSAPQCSLTSITANGGGAVDWAVTGQFTADVRAEKNSDGSVRIYSLHVTCTDRANNASSSAAIVVVGKDPTEIKAFQSRRPKR
jgi:probable HAF family extracellular repeat protein